MRRTLFLKKLLPHLKEANTSFLLGCTSIQDLRRICGRLPGQNEPKRADKDLSRQGTLVVYQHQLAALQLFR
jgi:hypothetical protein